MVPLEIDPARRGGSLTRELGSQFDRAQHTCLLSNIADYQECHEGQHEIAGLDPDRTRPEAGLMTSGCCIRVMRSVVVPLLVVN